MPDERQTARNAWRRAFLSPRSLTISMIAKSDAHLHSMAKFPEIMARPEKTVLKKKKTIQSQRRILKKICRPKKGRDWLNQTGAPEDGPGQMQKASSPNEGSFHPRTNSNWEAAAHPKNEGQRHRPRDESSRQSEGDPTKRKTLQATGVKKKRFVGTQAPKRVED